MLSVRLESTSTEFLPSSVRTHPPKIITSVPPGATNGYVQVTGPGGTATSSERFTVTTTPHQRSQSSHRVPGSSEGEWLSRELPYWARSVSASMALTTPIHGPASTQITTHVPAGATTGPVQVTTGPGTAISTSSFTVASNRLDRHSPTPRSTVVDVCPATRDDGPWVRAKGDLQAASARDCSYPRTLGQGAPRRGHSPTRHSGRSGNGCNSTIQPAPRNTGSGSLINCG